MKKEKFDGLSPKDIENIRKSIRKVWMWSYPRKLCASRAIGEDGFFYCELCKNRVPKIFVDHIVNVGDVDAGFIERLFCPSSGLQALCKKCHAPKTAEERARKKTRCK